MQEVSDKFWSDPCLCFKRNIAGPDVAFGLSRTGHNTASGFSHYRAWHYLWCQSSQGMSLPQVSVITGHASTSGFNHHRTWHCLRFQSSQDMALPLVSVITGHGTVSAFNHHRACYCLRNSCRLWRTHCAGPCNGGNQARSYRKWEEPFRPARDLQCGVVVVVYGYRQAWASEDCLWL